MGTLHKRTHRPLARAFSLMALFALFGVVGWNLPQLGSAALAYSTHAVKAARTALAGQSTAKIDGAATTVGDVQPKAASAAVSVAAPSIFAVDTPGQQALTQARVQLDSARASAKTNPDQKAAGQTLEAAIQNYNNAVALRVSEIKAKLKTPGVNTSVNNDTGVVGGLPSDYAALVSELKILGALDLEAPTPNVTAEVEPNNTAATAQTLNLAAQNVTIVGGSVTAGDQDWFKITIPANAKAWLYIDTGGTQNAGATSRDSQLTLFQSNGTTQIEFDDDDGSGFGLDTTVETGLCSDIAGAPITTAGDYLVKVNAFSATGVIDPYKLFVVVTTGAAVAESEPNNDSTTANAITLNASQIGLRSGEVNSTTDVDFFSVSLTAGNIVYFSVDGNPERDATNLDARVELRDTNGTTILQGVDSGFGGSASNPEGEASAFQVATSGTYFFRVSGFSGSTGTYNLLVAAANSGASTQVCPPAPITSSLGVAGGNFPKVSGTQTARLNRNGVVSACGVPRTQAAPISGSFAFDKYTFTNTSGATVCVFIQLRVLETAASNYMVGAFSTFVPTNLTSGWLGDPGLSSGIPPVTQIFSVNIAAGASFDVVVSNTNTTGNGNPYELGVFGLPGCAAPPACQITCPANITVSTAANQCGANVTYPAPATSGICSTVTCTPASGSFFQKGVTTVTCTGASLGGQPPSTCSFTVTVNDTQPPAFTPPPPDFFTSTSGNSAIVNYPLPTVSDNCPGVQPPVCVPAPGSVFQVGVTTVTCTVKDAVNNTATASFKVTVNRATTITFSDPLACTGPGNLITGSFSMTNTGTVSQTVEAEVTLPGGIIALPGSGTATIGTPPEVTLSKVIYTGTLAAGQTVFVTFQAQIGDTVPTGTTLCAVTRFRFNLGPDVFVQSCLTTNCPPVTVGQLIPSSSAVSDQKAGSVLIYPIYTSTIGSTSQNTRVSVTNINPALSSYVHVFFVSDICQVTDAYLCLTPNQTTTFQMSDFDPGSTGYIVMVAVDGVNGCPTNFNFLIGDEYVKFSSGHAANLAAESISAIAGGLPACNANSTTARLNFDDFSYNALPTTLQLDNVASRGDGNDTLLVINRIGGDLRTGPLGLGNLFGVLYDDAEASLSWTLNSSSCQLKTTINNNTPRTVPRFEQFITAGRSGWMRIWHRDDHAILGAAINFNPNSAASSGAFNQGHNLHKSTFTRSASFIIPVFPPACIN